MKSCASGGFERVGDFSGQKYPIGLRRIGDRQLYTNRGLGVWPLPYRFNCRPEITLFTLEAALLRG